MGRQTEEKEVTGQREWGSGPAIVGPPCRGYPDIIGNVALAKARASQSLRWGRAMWHGPAGSGKPVLWRKGLRNRKGSQAAGPAPGKTGRGLSIKQNRLRSG